MGDERDRRRQGVGGWAVSDETTMSDISDRLLNELVDAVKDIVRKEQSDRLRDIYLIGDIEKDSARAVIERLRELANDSRKPITIYINSAGGNVTDGLAIHDAIRHLVTQRMRDHHHRAGHGLLDGFRRAAGRQPGPAARVSTLVDHDSRAGEMGGLAIDHGRRAAPRSAEADAEPDLPHPGRSLRQAAAADHPGHQAHRLLPRRRKGARNTA